MHGDRSKVTENYSLLGVKWYLCQERKSFADLFFIVIDTY